MDLGEGYKVRTAPKIQLGVTDQGCLLSSSWEEGCSSLEPASSGCAGVCQSLLISAIHKIRGLLRSLMYLPVINFYSLK